MSIIVISRGSYTYGREVAEKVAQKLGYKCIGREIVIEASKYFNVPEAKLIDAVENAPSFLERFTYGKEKYIAYIQAAVLQHLKDDNVVYHGFAGHFFVKDVPNVLKIRIIADLEKRIQIVVEREKIDREKAINFIKRIDKERSKWAQYLYGIDPQDPSLYDLFININEMTIDDAVDIIYHTVKLERFQITTEPKKMIANLALAAEIKASLAEVIPDAKVDVSNGKVTVYAKSLLLEEKQIVKKIKEKLTNFKQIKKLNIKIEPYDQYFIRGF